MLIRGGFKEGQGPRPPVKFLPLLPPPKKKVQYKAAIFAKIFYITY